jgi:hypothetical protein
MAPSSSWLLQWLVAMQRPLQALGSSSSSSGSSSSSSSLTPVQLAQAAVALAELELAGRVPATWLDTWCAACEQMLTQLDGRQLSLCLWALAVLRHEPSEAWMGTWAAAMGRCGWQVQVQAAAGAGVGVGSRQGVVAGAGRAGGAAAVLEKPSGLLVDVAGPGPVMAAGSIAAGAAGLNSRGEGGDEAEAIARRISFACDAFSWQCSR